MLLFIKLQKLLTFDMQIKSDIDAKELTYLLAHNWLPQIRRFGISNGFINDDLRSRVYLYLFNADKHLEIQLYHMIDQPDINKVSIKYESVIEADIHRSFNTNELIKDKTTQEKETHKQSLKRILFRFFARNPQYHYYQGFNAVAGIFVMFYGEDVGLVLLTHFSRTMLEDYLLPDRFDKSIESKLQTIKKLVRKLCGVELQS